MLRAILIWGGLVVALTVPFWIAATSPLLAWRQPIYILAGFAGVFGLGLLLVQPLLAGALLPGLGAFRARRIHRWIGAGLVTAVIVHVVGLWITSPPDVIDVLLFRSPTPFSVWGVLAMWAIFAAALLAFTWKRLRLRPRVWQRAHLCLAALAVSGTVVHAVLIEGTMGWLSKLALCALVLLATGLALVRKWPRRQTAKART